MGRESRFEPYLSTRSLGLEEDVGGGHVGSVIGLFFRGLRICATDCTCSRPFWKSTRLVLLENAGKMRASFMRSARVGRSGCAPKRLPGRQARRCGALGGEAVRRWALLSCTAGRGA